MGNVIPAVSVTHERLASVGSPFDRSVHAPRSPRDDCLFGVMKDLRAESAAYVGSDDTELVLRNTENVRAHQQADDVWILARRVQRVFVIAAIVVANCRPAALWRSVSSGC